jgi:hypothetical protein
MWYSTDRHPGSFNQKMEKSWLAESMSMDLAVRLKPSPVLRSFLIFCEVLVGQFVQLEMCYSYALTPAAICLLASQVISWFRIHTACESYSRARRKIYPNAFMLSLNIRRKI